MTRTLAVFSLEPWDEVWRRNQYIVHGLLERVPGLRVLFVEPSRDHLYDLVSTRRTAHAAGLRVHPDYDGRLLLFQPSKWLPRATGPVADALLRRDVARVLRRMGAGDPILWINDPGWAHAVRRHPGSSLYDITDDWLAADRSPRELARLTASEALLFERCDAVVVCSTGLLERKRRQRADLVVIPNAVDVERYRRPHERPLDLPAAPTALYVGTLHEDRLDVGVAIDTARALRAGSGSLVFVGPVALSGDNRARLAAEPGIVMLGPRPRDAVPAYLQHADVLIVPHVVDRFTDSLDPIKLYEYLAVGRPIVATAVAGFRDSDVPSVEIASPDEFAAVVVSAAARRVPLEPGDVASWESRVTAFQEVLESLGTGAPAAGSARPTGNPPSSARYS